MTGGVGAGPPGSGRPPLGQLPGEGMDEVVVGSGGTVSGSAADPRRERVAVLDFGAQYTQLIARAVRACHVYCEILPGETGPEELAAGGFAAAILSGGPSSVYEEAAPRPHAELLASGLPLLGICYGHQLLAHHLGGEVAPGPAEFGPSELEVVRAEGVLAGFPSRTPVWMSHRDRVLAPPPGFALLGRTDHAPVAAMGDPVRRIYGVQFHPEVAHTPLGAEVLRNFLQGVVGLRGLWTMEAFAERAVAAVARQVDGGRAVVALSGGVDSAVAAALVYRAIGDRLTAVFVDHGLNRAGEADEVEAAFASAFPGFPLRRVDAADRFLRRLHGVTDPEEKRRRIGQEFVTVFEEEAGRLSPVDFLVQGTIYPDVVESGGGRTATIKTHHNVGGLPAGMRLRLLEPLRELFKDEVRAVGTALGLPEPLLWRQPFPGPGLAVRIVGEVTQERLALLRHADAIVREELLPLGLGRDIWQGFAVLPGVQSVGVKGDGRAYGEVVAVRAVTSRDGMTADWARLPHETLARLATRLVNEVAGVSRVVYDITSKPPATIEWE
jgi:GMP synthase (glutamine-hydrolysing)